MTFPETFNAGVQKLAPSAFALVMSTGIVSIGAHLFEFEKISHLLFFINKIQFAVLVILSLFRLFLFFPEVSSDLSSHAKGAGFLTLVAGSCLLGMQYVLLQQDYSIAVFLWFAALIMWLVIMFSFFISVITKKEKPSLEEGLNGSWLLIVVAAQSLSVLASTIRDQLPFPPEVSTFFSLATFLLGFVLYLVVITLVLYRLLFVKLSAGEFTPSYWIDMGACAITTLAAVTFTATNKDNPLFGDFVPVVKTLAVLSWSVSTWWIPIITLLEIWRHISNKFPVQYNAGYWSMVFPLGMYSVCTFKIAAGFGFHFLHPISHMYIFISLTVWTTTFLAMCTSIIKGILTGNPRMEAG